MARRALMDRYSTEQIEDFLRDRRAAVTGLKKKRKELARDLRQIDREIARMEGNRKPRRAGTESENGKPRRRRRRRRGKPLHEYITGVLQLHKEGLRPRDLTAAVLDAGYKSTSKRFSNVIFLALRGLREKKKVGKSKDGLYYLT